MSVGTEITCRQSLGVPAPECCQEPLEQRAARDERMAQRAAQLEAVTPKHCPACGAAAYPLFWVDVDVFDCANPACHAIFSGRGD